MKDLHKIELLELPLASCSENIIRTGYCLAFHLCNGRSFYKIKLMYLGVKVETLTNNNNDQEKFIQFHANTNHIKIASLASNYMNEIGFVFDNDGNYKFTQYDVKITEPEFQNRGLGSYCMHHVITWAKEKFPDASLKDAILSPVDAKTEIEKDLRNAFYDKCRFKLVFNDESNKDGKINGVIKHLAVPEIKPTIIIHPNGLQQLVTYMEESFLNENELEKKSKRFDKYISEQINKTGDNFRQGIKYGFFGALVIIGIIVSIVCKIL